MKGPDLADSSADFMFHFFYISVEGKLHVKFKQFNDVVFTNGTGITEVSTTQCKDPVLKHDCIYCCIETVTCNVVYIAYKNGSNQVDWCTLYHMVEVELISVADLTTMSEYSWYWAQIWISNGGQPGEHELAVFGKKYTIPQKKRNFNI